MEKEKRKCPYCAFGYGIQICEKCKAELPIQAKETKKNNETSKKEEDE